MTMASSPAFPIIDADVHVAPTAAMLEPYMETRSAAEYFAGAYENGHLIPRAGYRLDAFPPGGGAAGSDLAFMAEHLLDHYDIELAVMTPMCVLRIGEVLDVDVAAETAQALNRWQAEVALASDERYLASIVVAAGDPERAADEVRRWGAHPRFVQVFTTGLPCLAGDRFLHPIYEACDEHGLPFTLHVSGTATSATSKVGITQPATYFENRSAMCLSAIAHLLSIVSDGVFVTCPRMRFVLAEFGIAWLPWALWRMDQEYRANREDVPWLIKPPSEYVRDSVRFTTQPLEEPPAKQDLITLLSMIEADRLLCFSTDYPHHDFDDPDVIRQRLPEEWHARVFHENSRELFGLDRRVPAPVSA